MWHLSYKWIQIFVHEKQLIRPLPIVSKINERKWTFINYSEKRIINWIAVKSLNFKKEIPIFHFPYPSTNVISSALYRNVRFVFKYEHKLIISLIK